ncbi:uncharacterized protein PHACADRAFT_27871 [Phanerochaete carnosa HHB-10118-sp]|uniref:Uncharacterized protein n=1 Tax=Phanerochaete carnosa (strain HHB-10118-sp) TaxID=650164 RepID=K5VZX7_PHACS|nr:uncharacterized protein PHACADRAFT_27871 [Phanerochaete carnosa HHB-10118-sp]EKM57143.1 hypothetical protein PHACADRAFT_27871 [Phanerochaete carnosa HHB-10118-sp]
MSNQDSGPLKPAQLPSQDFSQRDWHVHDTWCSPHDSSVLEVDAVESGAPGAHRNIEPLHISRIKYKLIGQRALTRWKNILSAALEDAVARSAVSEPGAQQFAELLMDRLSRLSTASTSTGAANGTIGESSQNMMSSVIFTAIFNAVTEPLGQADEWIQAAEECEYLDMPELSSDLEGLDSDEDEIVEL